MGISLFCVPLWARWPLCAQVSLAKKKPLLARAEKRVARLVEEKQAADRLNEAKVCERGSGCVAVL